MNRLDLDRDLDVALSDLSRHPTHDGAPDLSRSIMGRLGYMRIGREVARRRIMRKWAARTGSLMVTCVALAIGWRVFLDSSHIRKPADTTIPQAIRHDVEHQQERIGSMLQTIRSISVPKIAPVDDGGVRGGRPTPESQVAPGAAGAPYTAEERTHPDARTPGSSVPAPNQTPDGQEMREDMNRMSRSPVRWV